MTEGWSPPNLGAPGVLLPRKGCLRSEVRSRGRKGSVNDKDSDILNGLDLLETKSPGAVNYEYIYIHKFGKELYVLKYNWFIDMFDT